MVDLVAVVGSQKLVLGNEAKVSVLIGEAYLSTVDMIWCMNRS